MNSHVPTIALWSYGLAGAAYTLYAVHLLRVGYRSGKFEISRFTVLLAVLFSAGWGWCEFFLLKTAQPTLFLVGLIADLLRYACWYFFFLTLLRSKEADMSAARAVGLRPVALVIVLLGFLAIGHLGSGVQIMGDATRQVLLIFMALPLCAMVLLEQVFRNSTDDSRWNIKPLCLGLAVAFLFDLYLFSQAVLFNRLDEDGQSIRGAVHAFIVVLLLISGARGADWMLKVRLSPKAAFHSATLLIAGVYLIFMSSVGYYVRYFGGEWGSALQLGLMVLAMVLFAVFLVSASIRASLRVFLSKHFFHYRYDYREEWLRFTQTLSDRHSPQDMGHQVVRGLADMLESPAGCLWVKTSDEEVFVQTACWNMLQCEAKEPIQSDLCQFMVSSGWVINLEEYRSYSRRYGSLKLPSWLQELPQAWLIVPLMVGGSLIGFVVLASARTRVDVNWEVNDLLKTAGQQAASFLAQMQATEALLEARKFEAFNRMSAFVVHDLKNIVTQLSLMMKNAKRLGDNPEFRQDMLLTVENSLDRMRQMMLQLREGATPTGTAFGVNLEPIVKRIQSVTASRGRALELTIVESVTTRGHAERLERIIGHVVQNAFDATPADGRVWLILERASGQAKIVVGDTGQGMSQEFVRDRLFKPFQTTKESGMGIGAYESFQYVTELGGKLEVESELNRGTRVTILLPMLDTQTKSDLHTTENI